jgi:SsrA-binding protein
MEMKVVARNRKAQFNYFLMDHFEAGIALKGSEIKSIRAGQASLAESYVEVNPTEAWLIDAHIAPYDAAGRFGHDAMRRRQLLLHKKEIQVMWVAIKQKGLTIVPLQIYIKKGRAKVDIAIAKGKKLFDKRAAIAQRDAAREMAKDAARKRKTPERKG